MRSLYLRIWLTVIVTLALFAGASGWLVQRHLDQERIRNQAAVNERIAAWGDLIQRSLPAASAPPEVQSEALRDWSQRLRVPMALEDEQGHRIAASESFIRREGDKQLMHVAIYQIKLDDGRSLYVMRPNMLKPPVSADPGMPQDEDIGGFGAEHHPLAGDGRAHHAGGPRPDHGDVIVLHRQLPPQGTPAPAPRRARTSGFTEHRRFPVDRLDPVAAHPRLLRCPAV